MTSPSKFFYGVVVVCLLASAIVASPQGGAGQIIQSPELEEFLIKGKVTGMRDIGEGVTLSQRATLEFGGTTQRAVFKTIDDGPIPVKQLDRGPEFQFQDSWRTEVAAYELDKLLGLGMVPVTIDRSYNGKRGSWQFWIESVMTEADRVQKKLTPPNGLEWNEQVAKVRLFDNLIYNTDRHLNNLFITSDWKIRLIDHSRSFRPFDQLKNPQQLTRFSRALLAKLEELTLPGVKEKLGKYLTTYQIEGLMKRRDLILALSKKLVAEKGAGAVLYR